MENQSYFSETTEEEKDYPKLLYATNKLSTDRSFIIRTIEPRFIAEVFLFRNEHEARNFIHQQTLPTVSTRIKKKIAVVSVKEFWDDPDDYEPKIIKVATKRLANWYKAQLIESLKRSKIKQVQR